MNKNRKINYDKFVGLRMSSSLYVMLGVLAKIKGKKIISLIREVLENYVRTELQIR